MTELVTNWLLIVATLSLLVLLCYILRDMARERRAEQLWREITRRAEREHTKALQNQVEKNRADIVRGMDRRA